MVETTDCILRRLHDDEATIYVEKIFSFFTFLYSLFYIIPFNFHSLG